MAHEILILDDEPKIVDLLRRSLAREGYSVHCESDPLEALARLKELPVEVLISDLKMPGMDGLEVLKRAKAIRPECEVIMMTAYATVETAREALKRGAIDYLTKPFSADEDLKPLIRKVFEADADTLLDQDDRANRGSGAAGGSGGTRDGAGGAKGGAGSFAIRSASSTAGSPPSPSGVAKADTHGEKAGPDSPLSRIVTKSPVMKKVLDRLPKIAASSASVLLRGESGTGKEVLADAIHHLSARVRGPLVKVNCGALPETLLESELFGHVKGSFTGAVADREGLFEASNGGTTFLDEIGEVSPALQVKLLRILQEGEFQRVGESRTRKTDVRIVAATNRNLEDMMREGSFRQDLFYRLNVVPILLPPLRERREDIPALIEYFCRRLKPGVEVVFSPEVQRALLDYDWPGNIRELENAVEHALVLGDPSGIVLEDLPVALQDFEAKHGREPGPAAVGEATLEDIERRCLLSALQKTGFNQTRAARLLGITRRTLGYRIRKYELEEEIERMRKEE